MSVPSKIHNIRLVKIQPEERLAATSEPNLASSLVTGYGEAKGMGYWAATQVKGFRPEIHIVSEADVVHLTEGSTIIADPTCKFTSLAHLLTADFLKECFRELKKDKAPGIDGVTWSEYEANLDENIEDLVTRLMAKQYRPQPVKRAYVPKSNGERRPLGIPALEDKIVQLAIKKILEAIFKVGRKTSSKKFRQSFYYHTVRFAFKWINRRSQKKSYNWSQFNRFLSFNPLPKPKVYHSYALSKRRGCTPEEPDEGQPQVRFCEGAHSNPGANTPIGGGL